MLLFLFAFIAEVVGTMVGFGSSTLFLPLALLLVDFKTALVLTAFLHIFGNLGRITFFRHGLDRRLIILFGVPSVLLSIIGASLVGSVSQDALKLILGAFLLIFAIVSLVKPDLRFPPTKASALIGGGVSGFFAGLIGTGGALRGSFLTAFGLEKNVYIATAALIALAVDATRLPVYVARGFLDSRYYWHIPVLLVVALAGSFLGKRIVDKVPQRAFKTMVLLALILIGGKYVVDSLAPLA